MGIDLGIHPPEFRRPMNDVPECAHGATWWEGLSLAAALKTNRRCRPEFPRPMNDCSDAVEFSACPFLCSPLPE